MTDEKTRSAIGRATALSDEALDRLLSETASHDEPAPSIALRARALDDFENIRAQTIKARLPVTQWPSALIRWLEAVIGVPVAGAAAACLLAVGLGSGGALSFAGGFSPGQADPALAPEAELVALADDLAWADDLEWNSLEIDEASVNSVEGTRE